MIKAFGYNPAGEHRDARLKLKGFLLWIIKTYANTTTALAGSLDAHEMLGAYGKVRQG